MKLTIKSVKEHGVLKSERIILKAIDDVNVGSYMLADTTYLNDNEVSNKIRHTFWIPDKSIEKGSLVVIYTKDGTDSVKTNKSGKKTYFFYWGLGKTVWNQDEDSAIIFLIDNWETKKV